METQNRRGSVVIGTILLTIGAITLLGQLIGPQAGNIWPFIVIGAGLAFFAAMFLGGRSLGALAIPGAIITGIGLILLFENIFNLWETMSYGWGLIISSVGVGLVIAGWWGERPDMVRSGWKVAEVGLVLFVVFGILFEVVFGFTGVSSGVG